MPRRPRLDCVAKLEKPGTSSGTTATTRGYGGCGAEADPSSWARDRSRVAKVPCLYKCRKNQNASRQKVVEGPDRFQVVPLTTTMKPAGRTSNIRDASGRWKEENKRERCLNRPAWRMYRRPAALAPLLLRKIRSEMGGRTLQVAACTVFRRI